MKKILFFSILSVLVLSACTHNKENVAKTITIEEAKTTVTEFINTNLMPEGQSVSIKEVTEENNLYKVVVNMTNGQEIISYLTKDGLKFFPQVMDIAEIASQNADKQAGNEEGAPAVPTNVPKAEKATVELFVMSHCPYGTQIEKGILPVLDTLGDKIDFELKFCDYAMHGEEEIFEQLNQYCIQKNEPQKLNEYLTCFLEAGDGETCLTETAINVSKLNACTKEADSSFKVTEMFEDQASWKSGRFPQFNVHAADNQKYDVSGSPTLVINGVKVPAGRDSASLLAAICTGFENQPAECETSLSAAAPSAGFGFSTTGSAGSAAECGS